MHDISVRLGTESIDYPGDTPYARSLILSLQAGGVCDLSPLVMSTHSGTHVDAPAHFIPGGKTIDRFPIEAFIRPALVVEVPDPLCVDRTVVEKAKVQDGEALLFKTHNSRTGRSRNGQFTESYAYVTPEAAAACVERKVGLVGIDYISVERYGDQTFPVHHVLLTRDILILEGLDLYGVSSGRYKLWCLPLKLTGAEASPVRAILTE